MTVVKISGSFAARSDANMGIKGEIIDEIVHRDNVGSLVDVIS
jgi:hypothetical protein